MTREEALDFINNNPISDTTDRDLLVTQKEALETIGDISYAITVQHLIDSNN